MSISRLGTCSDESKISYYTEIASVKYYSDEYEPQGIWFGNLASQLRINGKGVEHEALLHLAQGYSACGKRKLVKNAGKDHWIGSDLTFSAPKSVSVLFALSEKKQRERIQNCHLKAVQKTLKYIEKNIVETRIGFNEFGNRQRLLTNKVLFAIFEHGSSRKMDPQLHSHCLLLNLTHYNGKGFRAIESLKLHQYQKALGVMYRNELAFQLKEQLNVKAIHDEEFFKIYGVPDTLCKKFSKRSDQITDAIAEKALIANSATKGRASLFTREEKKHLPRNVLYDRWKEEAERWVPQYSEKPFKHNYSIHDYKEEILEELVEFQSVFHHRDLLEVVNKYAQWLSIGIDGALKYVDELIGDCQVIKLLHPVQGECFTTQNQLNLEKAFYSEIIEYSKISSHRLKSKDWNAETLNDEQKKALSGIVESGGVAAINGLPGTGKSFLFREVNSLYVDNGYNVIGCSIAAKAAESLQQSSGIKSQTLDSLLLAIETGKQRLNKNTVIVLDEAGMAGVNKCKRLYDHVAMAKAKLIFSGDYFQLSPINAGNPFFRLKDKVPFFELNNIQRQREEIDRQNILEIKKGNVSKVFEYLDRNEKIIFGKDHLHIKAMLVNDWYELYNVSVGEQLMIASTNEDVGHLNKLARQRLKLDKKLSGIPAQLINHEKQLVELQTGDRIMFRKNSYDIGINNGTTATIVKVVQLIDRSVNICAVLDSGKEVSFNSKYYSSLDYGYAISTHKSQGLTCENSFIFLSERYLNKELTYVQMSRSKTTPKIYCANTLLTKQQHIQQLCEKAEKNVEKIDLLEV